LARTYEDRQFLWRAEAPQCLKVAVAYAIVGWLLVQIATQVFPSMMVTISAANLDRKPAFWESGCMKTTLDLPDDLMRAIKIRAVHEQKKLKDAIAEFIRKGMAADKRRAKLPKPVKLRGGFIPTTEDIEAAIAEGRE
jgi:hypothetical protein